MLPTVDLVSVLLAVLLGNQLARPLLVLAEGVREVAAGNPDAFYLAKLQTARFYFAKLFPETASLMRTARAGSRSLMETDAALA